MKKWMIIFMLAVVAVFGAACGDDKDDSKKDEDKVVVDEGLLNVEITLPASMFEGEDVNGIIEEAKADGIDDVYQNTDGSLTYKMSRKKHNEILADLEKGMNQTMEDIKSGEDYPSIKDVTSNKKYDKFTFVVDRSAYESGMDSISVFSIAISSMYYQLFNGANQADYEVVIDIKDEATGEIFDTMVIPDDIEDMGTDAAE